MILQNTLMECDPVTGAEKPYPSHAAQWRTYHANAAWLVNPWTGEQRSAADVGADPHGHQILPPGETVLPEPKTGAYAPRYSRAEVQKWRDDIAHACADMASRYRADPHLISALRSMAEKPVTQMRTAPHGTTE